MKVIIYADAILWVVMGSDLVTPATSVPVTS